MHATPWKAVTLMAGMTKKPEVVFLYGPPFSGKALFFKHHFSETHKKINPTELFEADPFLSLRAVILKVVNTLNQGQSVVVDDENSSKKNRKSYMAIIRKKFGQCDVRMINFHVAPSSGLFICQWAREWELVHQFELPSVKLSERGVERWFQNVTEPPSEEEGFNMIKKVDVQLICDTPYEFVVPTLFFQWEGLFQCQEDQTSFHKAVANVVKKWRHKNLCGRVIILKLGEEQTSEGEKSCEWPNKMKQLIAELVIQVNVPIFLVHWCSYLWQFSRPPNPGVFAWLQRLHNIDLSNKATFYIHYSDDHSKAAAAAGVKCIKAKKLLQNPSMAVTSHDRTSENRESSHCITVTNKSYTHGVCFQDFASLERFNLQYQQAAIPTEPISGDVFNYKGCPVELGAHTTEKERSDENAMCFSGSPEAAVVPLHESPVRSKFGERKLPDIICPTVVVKSLTTEKIESHAFSPGHFRRGKGCTSLIRNIRSKTMEDGVLFSAKCIGSQDQLYDVSVVLNEKDLVRASCTCADPASKQGRCKHGIALLLRSKEEKNINASDDRCPPSNVDDVTMRSAKSASTCGDPVKRTKTEDSFSTTRCKRLKVKRKLETTMYFLSTEELLQTAQEILQENSHLKQPEKTECSRRQERECTNDQRNSKMSSHEGDQPYRGISRRESLNSSVSTDIFISKTTVEEKYEDVQSKSTDNGLINKIIPESVVVGTLESQSEETSSDVTEPLIRTKTCDLKKEKAQNASIHRKQETQTRTSILDEFI